MARPVVLQVDSRETPSLAPEGTPSPLREAFEAVAEGLGEAAELLRSPPSGWPMFEAQARDLAAAVRAARECYARAELLLQAVVEGDGQCAHQEALNAASRVNDHCGHIMLARSTGRIVPSAEAIAHIQAAPGFNMAELLGAMRRQTSRAALRVPANEDRRDPPRGEDRRQHGLEGQGQLPLSDNHCSQEDSGSGASPQTSSDPVSAAGEQVPRHESVSSGDSTSVKTQDSAVLTATSAVLSLESLLVESSSERLIRRNGDVWLLRCDRESGMFSVRGNKCLATLATVLVKPNYAFAIGELLGDPESKLDADGRHVPDDETDRNGLIAVRRELDDVEALIEVSPTEQLYERKQRALNRIDRAERHRKLDSSLKKAHHNLCTQIRMFIRHKLKKPMPRLAAHLKHSLELGFPHIGYYPPKQAPAWDY
jgi:hypothetical protein